MDKGSKIKLIMLLKMVSNLKILNSRMFLSRHHLKKLQIVLETRNKRLAVRGHQTLSVLIWSVQVLHLIVRLCLVNMSRTPVVLSFCAMLFASTTVSCAFSSPTIPDRTDHQGHLTLLLRSSLWVHS